MYYKKNERKFEFLRQESYIFLTSTEKDRLYFTCVFALAAAALFLTLQPTDSAILTNNAQCDIGIKTLATPTTTLPDPTHAFVSNHLMLKCIVADNSKVEFYKDGAPLSQAYGWTTIGALALKRNKSGMSIEDSGSYYCQIEIQGLPCRSPPATWYVSKVPPDLVLFPSNGTIILASDGVLVHKAIVCLKNQKDVGPLNSFYVSWIHSSLEMLTDPRFRQFSDENCTSIEIRGNQKDLVGNLTLSVQSGTHGFSAEAKFVIARGASSSEKATESSTTSSPTVKTTQAALNSAVAENYSVFPTSTKIPKTKAVTPVTPGNETSDKTKNEPSPPGATISAGFIVLFVLMSVVVIVVVVVVVIVFIVIEIKKSRQKYSPQQAETTTNQATKKDEGTLTSARVPRILGGGTERSDSEPTENNTNIQSQTTNSTETPL